MYSCSSANVSMPLEQKHTNNSEVVAGRARAERVLLVLALILLSVYGIAEFHGATASRAQVERFRELQAAALKEVSGGSAAAQADERAPADEGRLRDEAIRTGEKADFTWWSKTRIEAYKTTVLRLRDAPLALLKIPSIHLEVAVLEGTDPLTLNQGVGRIAGTGAIGEGRNIGIAGHRDGFFRGLKDISIGDSLELSSLDKTMTYSVDEIRIVSPDDVEVLEPRVVPSLTLVTCYPFYYIGAAPERFIVQAALQKTVEIQ